MQIRKTAVLVILCFSLASLGAFCQGKEGPQQTAKVLAKQGPTEIRKLVQLSPDLKIHEDVIMRLVNKIIEDNESLKAHFNGGNFIDVANLLGKRGTSLVTDKFKKMWGDDSAGFWRDSAIGGATLNPVVAAIYITDAVTPQAIEICLPDKETRALSVGKIRFDFVATVTQEFHVIHAGTVMQNATSCGGQVYRHQDICVWE
jgi:hypothetical protein